MQDVGLPDGPANAQGPMDQLTQDVRLPDGPAYAQGPMDQLVQDEELVAQCVKGLLPH